VKPEKKENNKLPLKSKRLLNNNKWMLRKMKRTRRKRTKRKRKIKSK
jgi:hypothetical protein